MREIRVVTADRVDSAVLNAFLSRFYPAGKAQFLAQYGGWWHRGEENRWVLLYGGTLAGYCAVIPGRVLVNGELVRVAWWVDLVVAPEFRGRGLQRILDERVKESAPLILGFPNELAARIHRRHGWGVSDDLRTVLCPLRPIGLNLVKRRKGISGAVLRGAAAVAEGPVWAIRKSFLARDVEQARRVEMPSVKELVSIASKASLEGVVMTHRDADWFRWRFLESPYRRALSFFVAGPRSDPSVAAIMRTVRRDDGQIVVRLLDLFGTIEDHHLVRDVLRLAVREAIGVGASQVTAMFSENTLPRHMSRLGFVLRAVSRFCWWSADKQMVETIGGLKKDFRIMDSDNDEP